MFREPSIGRHYDDQPQLQGTGFRSWITRGANFAVVCTLGEPGARLHGHAMDEQFVYSLQGGVHVAAGGDEASLDIEELAVVPPGESIDRITPLTVSDSRILSRPSFPGWRNISALIPLATSRRSGRR